MGFYTPDSYRVRDSIGYLVRRAANLLTQCGTGAFAEHELTFVQWLVLMYLRDGIAKTAAEISREMCHDSGALTRVLDQLDQRGLIARNRSVEDRRVVELALTDSGHTAIRSLSPLIVNMLNDALSGFDADEVVLLTILLKKLIAGLGAPVSASECAAPLETKL